MPENFDREAFLDAYIECALWADCMPPENDPDGEAGGREDLELRPGARETMRERGMVDDFIEHNLADLLEYCERRPYVAGAIYDAGQGPPEAYAGHDFWLTRNGHGAGFWDRGLGELGERLAGAARTYGSADDHTPFDCGDGTADV